ncbi:MAG: DUF3347 domain-containing protein [Candidatus Latescibacteria bacterium]|nr:DUF3347 domain-containing protein [Candidatus Latescibacterota bacterium]
MLKWLVGWMAIAVLVGCGSPVVDDLGAYLQAQQALAGDDVEKAKAALTKMAELTEGQTAELARQAAAGKDMAAVRASFKPLSEAVIGGELPKDYGVAYCPMAFNDKGARWVQKKGEIANPYFGASMLRCGGFEDN